MRLPYLNSRFTSATGKYDLYVLFLERSSELTGMGGLVGMIVPHKFTQAHFGAGIRGQLADAQSIKRLVSFGTNRVFKDASTYSCVVVLSSQRNARWRFYEMPFVESDQATMERLLREETENNLVDLPSSGLSEKPWVLGTADETVIVDKMDRTGVRLSRVVEGIFQGLITGADRVFFVEPIEETSQAVLEVYSPELDENVALERQILKPLLKGNDVSRYNPAEHQRYVLYPYHIGKEGETELYQEDQLRDLFPLCYSYLRRNHKTLTERGSENMHYPEWYALWNPRSIQLFEQPKVLIPDICYGGQMSLDREGEAYHTATVYSILLPPGSAYSLHGLLAILNSKALWFYLTRIGTPLRGDYYRYKTKYLERFPVPPMPHVARGRSDVEVINEAKRHLGRSFRVNSYGPFIGLVESYLDEGPEELALVHDTLAYLASELVELNGLRRRLDREASLFRFVNPSLPFVALDDVFAVDERKRADWEMDLALTYHDVDDLRLTPEDSDTWVLELRAKLRDPAEGWQDWVKEEDGHMIKRQWVPAYQFQLSEEKARFYRYALPRLQDFDNASSFPGGYTRSTLKKLHLTKVPILPDVDLSELARLDRELSETRRKIELTDDLIDQIVYKLYGLTEEEIAIVEGRA